MQMTYHVPVLLQESVDGLNVQPGGVYADLTFGGGGHSGEILRRLGAAGHLYGFDQDGDAERNVPADERFTFVRSNFRYLWNWMRYYGIVGQGSPDTDSSATEQARSGHGLDGVLADLGVSWHHFDDAGRGFSFRFDSPLDMRMNRRAGKTAADVVNEYPEQQLTDIFRLYGELPNARRLAQSIVKARQEGRIETTGQLLRAIGAEASDTSWKKEATKLFQALRIEVNREMEVLREMLHAATEALKPGGRLVVITYHSLEDRMVKNVMRSGNPEGRTEKDFFGRVKAPLHIINNKVITPNADELQRNPRSRSAKLRIAEKV